MAVYNRADTNLFSQDQLTARQDVLEMTIPVPTLQSQYRGTLLGLEIAGSRRNRRQANLSERHCIRYEFLEERMQREDKNNGI
eukprot:gene1627-4760_t